MKGSPSNGGLSPGAGKGRETEIKGRMIREGANEKGQDPFHVPLGVVPGILELEPQHANDHEAARDLHKRSRSRSESGTGE
jgi:hypothetical protein